MNKVNTIRVLNDGFAHLVELESMDRIIISWEQENDDRVDFKFYEDDTIGEESSCELGNMLSGEFTFINENADSDYSRSRYGYKLTSMFSPHGYIRKGLGTYIIKWFLDSEEACTHIYTSDPYDANINDGSEVTGEGVYFLRAMQKLDLIQDADKED